MTDILVSKYEIAIDDIDLDCYKNSAVINERSLVEASVVGNYEKISELLNLGVSVDAVEYNKVLFYASKNYMTPLQVASANGYVKCVQLLIDHGADVNAKDRFDVTALHIAAEKGHYLCLKTLLDADADSSSPTKFSKSGCYRAVPHPGGTTPLHLAAANNHIRCVEELIQYGADYNAIDECGCTSLCIAAKFGFGECVLTHLKNAVGRDILSLPEFETNNTPLHFAVYHKMVECVKELLLAGSDVNHFNNVGSSPLHIAVTHSETVPECMEILKLLLIHGYNTDINIGNGSRKCTPLDWCLTIPKRPFRKLEMAKVLLAYGANIRGDVNNFIRLELKSEDEDYVILKYVVRSLLHLPSFKDLNMKLLKVLSQTNNHCDAILPHHNHLTEPSRALFPMEGLESEPVRFAQYVFRQLMYAQDFYRDVMVDNVVCKSNKQDKSGLDHYESKLMWYEKYFSNPRTLKHCCRYIIRQVLGSSKIRHISKLPIPSTLQSYILLEYD